MLQRLSRLVLLAAGVLLAGCPESVNPLSDPADARPDPALYGAWHGVFDDGEIWLHVGPGERGMASAVLVEHDRKGGAVKTERYVAFPSHAGKLALLNVQRIDDDHAHGWSLMKYEVDRKKLTLWMTSLAAVRDDIKAGKLKGTAEDGTFGETLITAPGDELVKYFEQADPKRLFDKPLPFARAK